MSERERERERERSYVVAAFMQNKMSFLCRAALNCGDFLDNLLVYAVCDCAVE